MRCRFRCRAYGERYVYDPTHGCFSRLLQGHWQSVQTKRRLLAWSVHAPDEREAQVSDLTSPFQAPQRPAAQSAPSAKERPRWTAPDPDELARTITYLQAMSDQRYSDEMARVVISPEREDPDGTLIAAFRSAELVNRSVVAADFLVARTNTVMRELSPEDASNKAKQAGRAAFRDKIGRERSILRNILNGLKAQRGILDNAPNPRRRAQERLAQLNLKGDVPQGTFNRLLEEEKQKVVDRKRAAKAEAKQRAREAKAAARRS